MKSTTGRIALAWLLVCVAASGSTAVDYGSRLGTRRGGELTFEPTGPGVLFDALDPAVRKWYVPQELYNEYRWRQWEYTNYARQLYQRYVQTTLEGDYFYDLYGQFITRGWLIFDWSVSEPQAGGSRVLKTSRYNQWFSGVVISSDARGQYHMSATVGSRIRTTLTPLTFSKPLFDGIQFDYASDKHELTIITSRPSGFQIDSAREIANERSDATNLLGGRATAQVGDFVKVGVTYVNAFNASTRGQALRGNPLKGTLTEGQNQSVNTVKIRLSDDSPEDDTGGAAFFLEEMIITTTGGDRISNRRPLQRSDGSASEILDYRPVVEGGFERGGYRTADGTETIALTYELDGTDYRNANGPRPGDIEKLQFRLLVANDYRIDVTSNAQTNSLGQPVFLSDGIPERTVRAPGNVRDGSNQGFVVIDAGLPSANEIFGFTIDVQDVAGFGLQAEFDRNRQHGRYPRPAESRGHKHASTTTTADAWTLTAAKQHFPFYFYGEAYSIDPEYSTTSFIASQTVGGPINYDAATQSLYEFVDDNDDQDRYPDWQRRGQGVVDRFVFPGWDENNDFIADFNQNNNEDVRPNLTPDWEEPFLRYGVDRPQFLFGVDMNNNGYIDRFENDEEPDYPYRRDRRGYNAYLGLHLSPEARLTLGRTDEKQLADNRRNRTNYLLFSFEEELARWGKVRVFENLRRARDTIREDILVWRLAEGITGEIVPRPDILPARNTWINTLYLSVDGEPWENLDVAAKVKHEVYRQVDGDESGGVEAALPGDELRETSSFFGMIAKADYTRKLGPLTIQPRWKSEFQRFVPLRRRDPEMPPTTELRESAFLIVRQPVLNRSWVQAGVEYLWSKQFRDAAKSTLAGSDRKELVAALQFSMRGPYLGYLVQTNFGIRLSRIDIDVLGEPETETFMFYTIYAGLED